MKVCGIHNYFLREMKILNFLIGEIILENYKSVWYTQLFFTGDEKLNFLIGEVSFIILKKLNFLIGEIIFGKLKIFF